MKYRAAMIVLLAGPLVSAPPPRVVREIDLRQAVPARPGLTRSATFAFSPDENWLAVAVGAYPTAGRKGARNVDLGSSEILLLVPLNGTTGEPVQIHSGLHPAANPAWSPDSATVLVEGWANNLSSWPTEGMAKLWDLRGDELLSRHGPGISVDAPVGGIFGFLDSKHLLARRMAGKGTPAAFETVDLQGQTVNTWTVPKHWTVADISPERGLLAILSDDASKTLVVDNESKKVILKRGNPFSYPSYVNSVLYGRWQYFAESGKTLCSVGSVVTDYPEFDVPTECWDVDSGRKIAQFDRFRGGAPAAASSHGSRLLLTRDVVFPKRDGALAFPRTELVVWDFCSGAEIAAWEVPQIASTIHVALSSSGRYAAEIDGALLRIYKLP